MRYQQAGKVADTRAEGELHQYEEAVADPGVDDAGDEEADPFVAQECPYAWDHVRSPGRSPSRYLP